MPPTGQTARGPWPQPRVRSSARPVAVDGRASLHEGRFPAWRARGRPWALARPDSSLHEGCFRPRRPARRPCAQVRPSTRDDPRPGGRGVAPEPGFVPLRGTIDGLAGEGPLPEPGFVHCEGRAAPPPPSTFVNPKESTKRALTARRLAAYLADLASVGRPCSPRMMEALPQMATLFSTRITAPSTAAVFGRTVPISS
jgi:hypothetical protein